MTLNESKEDFQWPLVPETSTMGLCRMAASGV